jgi:hypothetical protein
MFRDFIGNELHVGDFFAYPGLGNRSGEYGMILHKITGFTNKNNLGHTDSINRIEAVRLRIGWSSDDSEVIPDNVLKKDGILIFKGKPSYISSTNKTVKINPPEKVQTVFNKILDVDASVFDIISAQQIANWIHGGVYGPETAFQED